MIGQLFNFIQSSFWQGYINRKPPKNIYFVLTIVGSIMCQIVVKKYSKYPLILLKKRQISRESVRKRLFLPEWNLCPENGTKVCYSAWRLFLQI